MLWLKQQSNTSSLCLRYLLNSPFFALLWAEILLAWQILCHLQRQGLTAGRTMIQPLAGQDEAGISPRLLPGFVWVTGKQSRHDWVVPMSIVDR